jgi:hypothetical protein
MLKQYDRWTRGHAMARRLERIFKNEDKTVADEPDEDSIASALRYLMHTPHGAGVLRRVFPSGAHSADDVERLAELVAREWRSRPPKDNEPVDLSVLTSKGTKTMDPKVVTIAKALVDTGRSFRVTEHDLTKMIEEYALRSRLSGESPEQAFSRVFAADDAEGRLFRKAVAVAKQAPLQVVGDDATDSDDPAAAVAQLERLAAALRRHSPELTEEQAFDRVFVDPANAALAARAHRRPTANAKNAFPFPR